MGNIGGLLIFGALFLIAVIIKRNLQKRVTALKMIILEDSAVSTSAAILDFPNATNNKGSRPHYLSFSVFDEFGFWEPFVKNGHVELWNFSKSIYLSALFNPSSIGIWNSFLRLWSSRVLPFLEKYVPAFLFLGLVEHILFDETGLFIATVFLLVLLSLLSIILGLASIPFLSRVKSGVNLDLEPDQLKNLNKSLSIIHFSPFYRCLGLFWRVVYVFKWLFRD